MSCDEFVIRQGDLLPPFIVDVETVDGKPIDLTGWTLTFEARGPVEISGVASWTAEQGIAYVWTSGNTDVPGSYEVVIRGVSPPPESRPRTFPTRGAVTLVIAPA